MKKLDYIHFDYINSMDTNNDSFDTTFTILQKYKMLKFLLGLVILDHQIIQIY